MAGVLLAEQFGRFSKRGHNGTEIVRLLGGFCGDVSKVSFYRPLQRLLALFQDFGVVSLCDLGLNSLKRLVKNTNYLGRGFEGILLKRLDSRQITSESGIVKPFLSFDSTDRSL